MSCLKCRNDIGNEDRISCDGCERQTHVKCSSLNANEIKVMTLRGGKRTLKFYCDDCLEGIRLVPKLLQKIDSLEEKLNQLTDASVTLTPAANEEEITGEIMERQRRSCNVIIFNMDENGDDITKVNKIFNDLINEDVSVQTAVRVGKKNKSGFRALKISLKDPVIASKIIRAKRTPLKSQNIYISADLTTNQRASLRKIQTDLEARKNNGEDGLVIKYVNGLPTIVKKSLN